MEGSTVGIFEEVKFVVNDNVLFELLLGLLGLIQFFSQERFEVLILEMKGKVMIDFVRVMIDIDKIVIEG